MSSDRLFPYSYKLASFLMLLPWFGAIAIEEKSLEPAKRFLYDPQGDWRQVAELFGALPFIYVVSFLTFVFDGPNKFNRKTKEFD